jgi:hypothetical protein
MAKDLVRTRKYIQKFYQMRTQLQAVGLRIQASKSSSIEYKTHLMNRRCDLINKWLKQ